MSSRYGSKGLIFTLDVVFAVGITLILLLFALSNLVSSQSTATDINAKRIASDIIAILDYNDILDTYNKAVIETAVNQSLPVNVKMYMLIGKYNKDGQLVDQMEINPDIAENYFFGKWIYVTGNPVNNFYLIRYKVGFV